MKMPSGNPLIPACACVALGVAFIVVAAARPELRWIFAALFAAVCLGAGMAVRREFRMRAYLIARSVANIAGFHRGSAGVDLAPVLDVTNTVDGRGRLFEPVSVAAARLTEQMRSERARLEESRNDLEVLLEGMQDAVLGLDAAGRVQWSNGHMQRLLGSDAAGASVRHGRALVHTVRDPLLLATVQRSVEEHATAECRTELLLPGRIFDVSASPLPGGGAVVVLRDSTRAEALERAQRDFVANVSHELRTPLTSIVGYVETVIDHEELSAPAREFLDTVLKNASRMNRLTEDLLLLTRVEQAANPLEPQPVDAETLLREAVRTVAGSGYAEGAHLQVLPSTHRAVLADENAILQVLGNLLENAVKYSGGRMEAADVRVSAVEDGEGMVLFTVSDRGPGIPSEHLPRIFERFYRVEKARSRATGGTGLGLSIARHLVQQHGGSMGVDSTLGEGSTFYFTLPTAD